jgi:hypothetical protein
MSQSYYKPPRCAQYAVWGEGTGFGGKNFILGLRLHITELNFKSYIDRNWKEEGK